MVDLPSPLAAPASRAAPPIAAALRLAGALLDGGARVLQLRWKGAPAADLLVVALALVPPCRARAALLVVNDRLDVALAAGADGVHLGQDDLPLADARRLAPPGFLIGVSTHDLAQARAAATAPGAADYLGFGPVFATATKLRPDPVVGLDGLRLACAAVAPLPVVAIGGITLATVAAVADAGAACAALVAAVNHSPDPAAAAATVDRAFAVAADSAADPATASRRSPPRG